jgi:hypothetical protein
MNNFPLMPMSLVYFMIRFFNYDVCHPSSQNMASEVFKEKIWG